MAAALTRIDDEDRMALERAANRIESFARAQRESILELSVPVPGGRRGTRSSP
jgi:histidinol dehydrogenase